MTTLEAEIKLLEAFEHHKLIMVPGVTRLSRLVQFETDMLVVSKAGYATAIEIKVSRQDLKKDSKKPHIRGLTEGFTYKRRKISPETVGKYFFKSIKNFYYAVPGELIDLAKEEIPAQAGLINLSKCRKGVVSVVREPAVFNEYKWSQEEQFHLLKLGCMRVYKLKKALAAE